jgi:CubicO group peptidase (beta-lactamase class C family)
MARKIRFGQLLGTVLLERNGQHHRHSIKNPGGEMKEISLYRKEVCVFDQMSRFIVFSVCLLSLEAFATPFEVRVHQHLLKQTRMGRFAGSVAVVFGNRIIFRNSYGLADVSADVPHQPQSPFPLASISKQYLAAGVLKASFMGLLNLKDPISKYIPQAAHWKGITIEHLLSHSSGLRQITMFSKFYSIIGSTIPLTDMVNLFLPEPLNGPPGENYEYSQYGYHVLARALEVAAKMSYGQFLKKFIFGPALMNSTLNYRETMILKNIVRGSEIDDSGVKRALFSRTTVGTRDYKYFISMDAVGAGGDIVSSLDELIRWDLALKNGLVFSKSQLDIYHSELFRIKDGEGYGFGLVTEKGSGHSLVSHSGGLAGISNMMLRYLDTPLSIYVLSNRVCAFKDEEVNKTCSANFHARKIAEEFFTPKT